MVSDREFSDLKKEVQANKLGFGVGYNIVRTAAGTTLQIKSGKSSSVECPFDVRIAADDDDLIITLVAGTCNNLLPDNIFDEFTVSASDLTKVKVRATSDGQSITGVTLLVNTADATVQVPTPFGLPSSVDIMVAVIIDGVAWRTIPCGSINLTGAEQFRTDKSPPAQAGELPYVPYYIWR